MENTTMRIKTQGTMSKLMDVLEIIKITPSKEIIENADMLSEAVANLKIKVGEVALDGVRNE
jgi:hypothetical protein